MKAGRSTWRVTTLALAMLALMVADPTAAQDGAPALEARPGMLDFGAVERSTDFEGYFVVRNVGVVPVTVTSFSKSVPAGMTLVVDDGCSGTIQPGDTCSVNVFGFLTAGGTFTATLRIASDDPHSPLVLRVRARMTVPPPPPPVMSEAPMNERLLRAYLPPKRSARFMWTWWARDPDNLSGFTAQVRTPSGGWRTVVRPKRPFTDEWQRAAFAIPSGRRVTVRARPHDAKGKPWRWKSRSVKVTYRDIRVPDRRWKRVAAQGSAYDGDVVVTRHNDAELVLTAKARGIAILGRTGRSQGWIRAMGDDGWYEYINLDAKQKHDLQVLHSWHWEDLKTRTVSVSTILKDGQSSVALDAWVIVQ